MYLATPREVPSVVVASYTTDKPVQSASIWRHKGFVSRALPLMTIMGGMVVVVVVPVLVVIDVVAPSCVQRRSVMIACNRKTTPSIHDNRK
jgi:hypothetical protein